MSEGPSIFDRSSLAHREMPLAARTRLRHRDSRGEWRADQSFLRSPRTPTVQGSFSQSPRVDVPKRCEKKSGMLRVQVRQTRATATSLATISQETTTSRGTTIRLGQLRMHQMELPSLAALSQTPRSTTLFPHPERLSDEQRRLLTACLSTKTGTAEVNALMNHAESFQYAQDFSDVLVAAGWNAPGLEQHQPIPVMTLMMVGGTCSGVLLDIPGTLDESTKHATLC